MVGRYGGVYAYTHRSAELPSVKGAALNGDVSSNVTDSVLIQIQHTDSRTMTSISKFGAELALYQPVYMYDWGATH